MSFCGMNNQRSWLSGSSFLTCSIASWTSNSYLPQLRSLKANVSTVLVLLESSLSSCSSHIDLFPCAYSPDVSFPTYKNTSRIRGQPYNHTKSSLTSLTPASTIVTIEAYQIGGRDFNIWNLWLQICRDSIGGKVLALHASDSGLNVALHVVLWTLLRVTPESLSNTRCGPNQKNRKEKRKKLVKILVSSWHVC